MESDPDTLFPPVRDTNKAAFNNLGTRGSFDAMHTVIGAGVAIFHLASAQVVLCKHSVKDFYFLPKGRRDANEETRTGAEREGFEEVCICLLPQSFNLFTDP